VKVKRKLFYIYFLVDWQGIRGEGEIITAGAADTLEVVSCSFENIYR
jgi:hypothetical protein